MGPAGLLRSFLLVAASDDQLLGRRGNSLYNVFREKRLIAVWAKRSHLRAAPRFVDHLGRTAADCKLLCLMQLSAAPVQVLQAASNTCTRCMKASNGSTSVSQSLHQMRRSFSS